MPRLTVTPKAIPPLPAGPPAVISVGDAGRLQIHCDDDPTFELIQGLLARRIFVQGYGFPVFRRDDAGRLMRAPDTGRLILEGYADLSAEADQLLQAIADNLEATDQFDLLMSPCNELK